MSSEHWIATGNVNSFNVSTNHNNIVNFITEVDTEEDRILRWLSPLEPRRRHQGVRTDRLDSIGNWVLGENGFKQWRDREGDCVKPVLFCCGSPGVGKTYLSSLVIDSLCDQAGGKNIAVVGLYCDFLARQEQSTTNMLGAILKQLANRERIPEDIRGAFRRAREQFSGRGLQLSDQVEIMKKAIASLSRVFICIDALDESTPQHRRGLLESLQEIVRVSGNTRIFFTGRPHIEDEIMKGFGKVVKILLSPTQDDIESYLEMRLSRDTDPHAMDDELRADIMRAIPERTSKIFLLVSLNIDAILGELTLYQRRKKLEEMTKGDRLGDAYAETLSRVKAQQGSRSRLGIQVLMWVSHSERPLRVEELCHALGVEQGSTDLEILNIPRIETLLACTLGLVTIEKPSSTVRPVHYTLQEYLSHNPTLFLKPHSTIAEACLTYLNFGKVRGISPTLRLVSPTVPFVEYASCHWGTHARRETTEHVKKLALKLLGGYDKHISSKILLLRGMDWRDRPFDQEDSPRGFTGLHGAAYFGCVEIMVALLETGKWDMRATDWHGNTAIAWAARRGHEGVVNTLLEQNDVNPNTANKHDQTPLYLAAKNRHEAIVRMLLERRDVNPNTANAELGQALLLFAMRNRYKEVMRILLKRNDANPNTPDEDGQTPLLFAAQNGHEAVVRTLLERGNVNPNSADNNGQTPLSFAVQNTHEAVVRILLERNDVNPNTANKYGRTPLWFAVQNRHEAIFRMLLERNDVNPNTADIFGQTPLLVSVLNGREAVVKILVQRDNVNPNTADSHGRTPLSFAAQKGHKAVVMTLLQRNEVNPDLASRDGLTPLSVAAQSGHEAVVKILLERNGVNPDSIDTIFGQTPLSWAARNGHEGVVKALLERNGVNPDTPNEFGRTPLSFSAQNGHERVVGILLERHEVNPNTVDILFDQTPLSFAAQNRHEAVMRILLQRNDVNPNTADAILGQTLLLFAVRNRYEVIVRILLERNDVNPDTADKDGRTPLSFAAQNGHEAVMRILLERNDVNPNTADEYGRTPLLFASQNGHEGVVKILLERNDVNPNSADLRLGQTLLSFAVRNGHEGIAKLLQERIDFTHLTEPSSPKPSDSSEPPFKRTRRS